MARKLTEMQATFVDHASKGIPRTQAARLAGFSAPAVEAYRLMKLPHVVEALHQRRDAALKGDLAHLAVETMRDLMGPTTPAATRYNAARWVLEHAGHTVSDEENQGGVRPLEEMNSEELAQAVSSGMQALQELSGQLEGHHVVDGQARLVRTIAHATIASRDEEADFLQ